MLDIKLSSLVISRPIDLGLLEACFVKKNKCHKSEATGIWPRIHYSHDKIFDQDFKSFITKKSAQTA